MVPFNSITQKQKKACQHKNMPSLPFEIKTIYFFKKKKETIDLRNVRMRKVRLKKCFITTFVGCCLSFFLNAKRKVSIRIEVIQWHHENEKNVNKTVKNFFIDRKQV